MSRAASRILSRISRAAAHGLRDQVADFLAELRQPLADVVGNLLFDVGNCALDLAQSLAHAAFHVAGHFAHDSAREPATVGDELAGGVEHAAHEGGNLAADIVDQILEGRREGARARAVAAAGEIALARVGAGDNYVGAARLDCDFGPRARGRIGTDRTMNMIVVDPLERGGVDSVSADSAPPRGGIKLERRAGVDFDIDASAAGDVPGLVGREGPGQIDGAADFFEIECAADAADACVAADKADCDFTGDAVGSELAADFSDLESARQVRGAYFSADDARFDLRGVLHFEMPADHARDKRRAQPQKVHTAGYFFDRHFAVDRAAIESAGNMAEGYRASRFDRQRAAHLDTVNRAGLIDSDVAADGIEHRNCAHPPRMQIAAHALDDKRRHELGDGEVARNVFEFDADALGHCYSRVVTQRHLGDARVDVDARVGVRVDLNCGTIGAADFQISGRADDADRFNSFERRDSHNKYPPLSLL